MPSLKRATKRRSSERLISASVIRPVLTASTSARYSLPQVRSVPALTATAEASAALGLYLWPRKMSLIAPQSLTMKPWNPHSPRRRFLQQIGAGAGGDAIHAVVGAHHGIGLAFHDAGAERGQIGLVEVARAGLHVELVARRLGSAVHGVVLGGGDHLEVVRIVALHALDEGHGHAAGEERIFAVGLLAAAPARIAEDVDVGRPEGEAAIAAVIVVADGLVVLGARLGGDGVGDAVHQVGVPGGGEPDGLREDGGLAGARDAVQRFVPPVVGGDAEARDARARSSASAGLFRRASCAPTRSAARRSAGRSGSMKEAWVVRRLAEQGRGERQARRKIPDNSHSHFQTV